jgi:membrane-associated phospholipid phosphatase
MRLSRKPDSEKWPTQLLGGSRFPSAARSTPVSNMASGRQRRCGRMLAPGAVGAVVVAFALLAWRIRHHRPPALDARLLSFLSPHEQGQPARFLFAFAAEVVGEYRGLWFAVLLAAALIVLRRSWAALVFGLVLGATLATAVLLKPHFDRPSLVHDHQGYFPSTHAAGAMVMGISITRLTWSTRWRWAVLAISLGVTVLYGAALVYTRSHYPSDVVGGWCIALGWSVGALGILQANASRRRGG